MTDTKPPTYDKTQKRRQARRRQRLDEIARDAGYPSWSNYETSVLNHDTEIKRKEMD